MDEQVQAKGRSSSLFSNSTPSPTPTANRRWHGSQKTVGLTAGNSEGHRTCGSPWRLWPRPIPRRHRH